MKVTTEEMAKVAACRNAISARYESETTLVENLISSNKESHPDCSEEEVYSHVLEDRNKLQDEFSTWAKSNLDDKLKSVALSTFNSILKEKLRSGLRAKYIDESCGSLNTLESVTTGLLESVTKTYEFKSKADSNFISVIDTFIKSKLESIIASNYGKNVTIKESFIEPGDTFSNIGVGTDFLHGYIAQIADGICNTIFESVDSLDWSKSRDKDTRIKLVDALLPNIDYDVFAHSIDLNQFVTQVVGKIDKILYDNGLIYTSL